MLFLWDHIHLSPVRRRRARIFSPVDPPSAVVLRADRIPDAREDWARVPATPCRRCRPAAPRTRCIRSSFATGLWVIHRSQAVAHSQEAHFRAHVASVSERLDTCGRLVARIDEVDAEVDGMLEGWQRAGA